MTHGMDWQPPASHDAAYEPVILLRDVSFGYTAAPALEGVNLCIGPRELVCVIGPNGGGKTTLLRLILGLLAPQAGEVRVFGGTAQGARPRIGYMPQHVRHDPQFPVSVRDVVLMGRLGRRGIAGLLGWPGRADRQAVLEALRQVDMHEAAGRPFAALSGGERQRVLIARALCTQPDLLLLDEPTVSVDTLAEARLFDLLRRWTERMTIVVVSHDLGFVSGLARSVVCVNRRVVVHPTSQLTPEAIRDVYGADVRMVRHGQSASPQGCTHEGTGARGEG